MSLIKKNINFVYGLMIACCFLPIVSPAIGLCAGLCLAMMGMHHQSAGKFTGIILQVSIVLMGFSMNLTQVLATSKTGFVLTVFSVVSTVIVGLILGKIFKVDKTIALLISSGTAICGGSAIAAVAPVIDAKNYQVSFSLVVIFILNAIALFLFPAIGHYFGLSQHEFGYWAAIAIHDTSSVVGAGASYGEEALAVATTVKLTRTLWIIPLTFAIAFFNKKADGKKITIPWFIAFFIGAIVFAHFVTGWQDTYTHLTWLGRKGMVLALFLIGSNISIAEAKNAGFKSFLLGITLWIFIAASSLLFIHF